MVWLVQNCRSNKCMYFLRPQELWGGGYPPGPPTRALSWNRWGTLSGPQTPLLLTPPPNPKSWIRPWYSFCYSCYKPGDKSRTDLNLRNYSEQIYHVWKGYLRKIPVERRTISRFIYFVGLFLYFTLY